MPASGALSASSSRNQIEDFSGTDLNDVLVYTQHSHCSYCGQPFDPAQPWPRTCAACYNISFLNPLPVAVVVQPVVQSDQEPDEVSLLLIQRAIQPRRGKWALPGGYIDRGERWQEAAVRELYEETGIRTAADSVDLLAVHSGDDRVTLIIFGQTPRLAAAELPPFVANAECSARTVVTASQVDTIDFAFPLHRRMVSEFFRNDRKG